MAVGNQNRQNNGKAYTAKLTLKEGAAFLDVPHFTFQAKNGSEYVTLTNEQLLETFGVEGPIRDVAGDLIALDTRTGEFEGKPIHNVTLSLRDSARGEVYFTQFISNNNLGRSISNSLLNLKAFENVQLGLWGQTNKEAKKTFPACSIRQGGSNDTVKWKFDPKTAPELKPREFEGVGGKLTKDWTKVDDFLFAELAKLGEFLKSNRPSKQESAPAPAAAQKAVEPIKEAVTAGGQNEEEDSAPF